MNLDILFTIFIETIFLIYGINDLMIFIIIYLLSLKL